MGFDMGIETPLWRLFSPWHLELVCWKRLSGRSFFENLHTCKNML